MTKHLILLSVFYFIHFFSSGQNCLVDSLAINTGFDPTTNMLVQNGLVDPHWTIGPISQAVLNNNAPTGDVFTITGPWGVTNNPTPAVLTSWVNLFNTSAMTTMNNTPNGSYAVTYEREFDMCNDDTVSLNLDIACDNSFQNLLIDNNTIAAASVNGVNYNAVTNYSWTGFLTAGTHTISITIINTNFGIANSTNNHTGLYMDGDVLSQNNSIFSEDSLCASQCYSCANSIPDTITSDTYLTGQVGIPDNTIIIVDGATLDITNVDVVFGQCAGIDFINGAQLRSNNSVFRPCSMNDTWRGLRFERQADFPHQINENTFKNAEIALLFERDADAELNSNTFSNCNESVTLNRSYFTETIFGNNFITNNAYPEYSNCYPTTSSDDVIHIHCVGIEDSPAEETMMIVQNNFAMNNTSGTVSATAIDMLHSQASITENTLTNMEYGIVIHDPKAETHIESNEIENNNLFSTVSFDTRQIFIDNSNGVYVSINYNELTNSLKSESNTTTGISLERADNVSIQNNEIVGFTYGILGNATTNFNISENVLTSNSDIGIFINESGLQGRNFITCNDITMDITNVSGFGFGIYLIDVDRFTRVTSNCVKDCGEAISLFGSSTLPMIRNNFLYNYSIGISNSGYIGSIGTPTEPGMNTFYSNSGGIDIFSSTPISAADNFGLMIYSTPEVQISQNITTHSTASCGHQIYSTPSQGNLNTDYTCDNNDRFILPKRKSNGSIHLPEVNSAIAFLQGADNKMNVIRQFVYLEGCDLNYLTQIMNDVELVEQDKNLILYTYHKFNKEFATANGKLDLLVGTDYEALIEVERLIVKNAENGQLSQSDFIQIETILNNSDLEAEQYNVAVALSKMGSLHGKYRSVYPETKSQSFDGLRFSTIEEGETKLEIFPNPSTNEISVQLMEGKIVQGQELYIYNIYGTVVQTIQLDFVSGNEKVNISTLASGTYFVVLVSDDQRSERTKFVKL